MNKNLLLIFSIMLSISFNAVADRIVAVVEDTSITLSELQHRKKLIGYFNQIKNLSPEQDAQYTKMVLQSMIDDQVLLEYTKKVNMTVSPADIDRFISSIETNGKMQPGQLANDITRGLHVPVEEFRKKMKIELMRSKVIREVLYKSINISQHDVESLILATNFRDAILDLKIVTAKNNNDTTRKLMTRLSKKIKSCKSLNYLPYKYFADVTHINTKLSALSPLMQTLVKDMSIDQVSPVIEDDELRIVVVCDKAIDKISSEENISVARFLGNKKLQIKAQKFFQDLRKKHYVKVMM